MRKVLITGSSGHLGSKALVRLKLQYEVHALVRNKPSTAEVDDVVYHEIDLARDWSISKLPGQMDAVIHLAQSRNYRNFPGHALETFRVNTGATALLLDYSRQAGASHFILASTGGLYPPSSSIIDESTPVSPPQGELAYYFGTKRSAELLASPYASLFAVTVLRPFFIYGPGQSAEKLIARLIASVRERRTIRLTGEDGMKINPIHVDDAADLVTVLLGSTKSRILNVAGPDVVSIRQIAEYVGQLLAIRPVFEQLGSTAEMIVADHRAVSEFLGRDLLSFSAGLQGLIE